MLLVGLSWLTFWLLIDVFTVEITKAALVTAIIFLVLGLLLDDGPNLKLRRP
jgi:hypothetical protein